LGFLSPRHPEISLNLKYRSQFILFFLPNTKNPDAQYALFLGIPSMNLRIAPSGLIFIAFWLFGLINNVLYVVNLSAAIDLVGPLVPKATVLLADVMPSFLIKLCAPFFVHVIPYKYVF